MDLNREQLTGLQYVGTSKTFVEGPSSFQNVLHCAMSSLLLRGNVVTKSQALIIYIHTDTVVLVEFRH